MSEQLATAYGRKQMILERPVSKKLGEQYVELYDENTLAQKIGGDAGLRKAWETLKQGEFFGLAGTTLILLFRSSDLGSA